LSVSSRSTTRDVELERVFRFSALKTSLSTYRGVIIVLAALLIFCSIAQSSFATVSNFQNVIDTNAILMIVAVGMTFPMLAGGFDLSVAGIDALSGVLLAKLLLAGVSIPLAILIIVVGALMFGALTNGVLIGYFGVNFFIVTLGTLTITQGVSLQFTGGNNIPMFNEQWLIELAGNNFGGVPIIGMVAAGVLVLGILIMRYTGFGRMIYAVGGNPEASRLAGINVARVRLATYAVSASLAGLAGVLEVGRLASAGPTTDGNIELTAAAAVLIGGVAFGGGIGTLFGTFLGVFFLGALESALLLSGISSYWQSVITGVVLITSVTLDRIRGRRGAKKKLLESVLVPVTQSTEANSATKET